MIMQNRKLLAVALILAAAFPLTSCNQLFPYRSSGYGPIIGAGLKPASMVDPIAKDFANKKVSLDQALDTPESRADGGRAIANAIKDLPPAGR